MKIPLTQDKFAIIDDEDYEKIKKYKWFTIKIHGLYYAQAYIKNNNVKNYKNILMHRLIFDAKNGEQIDHINRNGLDNRKNNLRFCSYSQNAWNSIKQINNTTGYKGVTMDKRRNKYISQICFKGRHIFIGYYTSPQKAALAYNQKAKQLFGEFARLNPLC